MTRFKRKKSVEGEQKVPKPRAKKEPIIYEGIACDSMEEAYFLMWVFELKKAGLVVSVERAPEYQLFEGHHEVVEKTVELKTKTKVTTTKKSVLNPLVYTPDFVIVWAKDPIFFRDPRAQRFFNVSIVEVKPEFDQNGKTALFVVKQKWLWKQLHIFVNLCKVPDFFKETFTPAEYLITSKTKQARKVKWEVRTCEEYLSSLKTESNEAK